jgi:hypothetical protein
MNPILDCTNFETTKKSIALIFNINENTLISNLQNMDRIPENENLEDYIYEAFDKNYHIPDIIDCIYFHGTRTRNPKSFLERGILPKKLVEESIWHELIILSKELDIPKSGKNPCATSFIAKTWINSEGPFGFLFKEAATHPSGLLHNYTETPEIVEDISGCLLGKNYIHLVNKYKEITKPYIISFSCTQNNDPIRNALLYLHLVLHGWSAIEAASEAVTCFDGNGVTIDPASIKYIECVHKP